MSRLNRIAAVVGLAAGGLGTLALLRYQPGPTPERACLRADFPGDTCDFWVTRYGHEPCAACAPFQATELAQPEWRRRLAERQPTADWYRRRHHCAPDVIGSSYIRIEDV